MKHLYILLAIPLLISTSCNGRFDEGYFKANGTVNSSADSDSGESTYKEFKNAIDSKDYERAQKLRGDLIDYHTTSKYTDSAIQIWYKLNQDNPEIKTALANKAKENEAEEKEKVRLANINNTGIWGISYYSDEFGEPTNQRLISNKELLIGTFSNTATQDSDLTVELFIDSSNKISIMLYEYARNNPVKAYSSTSYSVLVQDKDLNRLKLNAVNYSDRLTLDKTNSKKLHDALLKGGTVKFRIVEKDTPTTIYNFTIENADWYDNAYKKLKS